MQALEREPSEREAWVTEELADEPELLERAMRMVGHAVDEEFLETSAMALDEQLQVESMIGQTIGRIRIDGLLARGGMGEVYRGFDLLLERPVAVKLIRDQWRLSPERRKAFLAEARALSALAHRHICQVHDFFSDSDEHGSRDVLVLDLIEGQTVRQWLEQEGKPTRRRALEIALQIAEALVSAHERGIAHRDLKPDNVMLTVEGRVKVLDFGLARSVPLDDDPAGNQKGTQTAGTPGYLAPEQACGEPATTASDLWSFGCVLIELLTGKAPFDVTQPSPSLLDKARKGLVNVPRQQPRAEKALLHDLLSIEPGDRPSARELRDRLKRLIDRPRRRLRVVAFVAAVVLLAGAGLRYTTDLQAERDLAEAARAEAEELAHFMLEDLYLGLLRVGRLDLLEPVADKTVEYFVTRREGLDDRPDTGMALMRSSQVLDYQGRLGEAIATMAQAIERLRTLQRAQPDNVVIRYNVAYGLNLFSSQLAAAGRYADAEAAAREAAEIAEQLLAGYKTLADVEEEEIGRFRGLLLNAWYELGNSLTRAGQFDPAIELLDASLNQPFIESPHIPELDKLTADLHWIRCLAHLERGSGSGGIEACTPPLTIDRIAYNDDPENAFSRQNLAISLWLISRARRQAGELEAALESTDEAEQLMLALIEWDPDQPEHANSLAAIILSRARALDDAGRETERQAALAEARALTEPLIGDGDDPMVLHNHATVVAMQEGASDQARYWAGRLLDSGWNRPQFLNLCRELALDRRCGDD